MKKLFTAILFLAGSVTLLFAQNSENINRVIEYRPAPGQHINRLFPSAAMSDTPENALAFANSQLVDKKAMLGLGAFGGYVIVGFDHAIVNVPGEYDFKVLGNAGATSAEPGIVMVCQDLNGNGIPDPNEPWYELAGSEYSHPETIKDYEITYFRPEPDGQKSDIRWTDNQGNEGVVTHISFASQGTMYPLWIEENILTFKATRLRSTATGSGNSWQLPPLPWGYADNHPNSAENEKIGFNIEWAVDADGNPVELTSIDFIKIHTAQVQETGWLGETSTEVTGVIDLHPDAILSSTEQIKQRENLYLSIHGDILTIKTNEDINNINIFNMQGMQLLSLKNSEQADVAHLPKGVYILQVKTANGKAITDKFVKQ